MLLSPLLVFETAWADFSKWPLLKDIFKNCLHFCHYKPIFICNSVTFTREKASLSLSTVHNSIVRQTIMNLWKCNERHKRNWSRDLKPHFCCHSGVNGGLRLANATAPSASQNARFLQTTPEVSALVLFSRAWASWDRLGVESPVALKTTEKAAVFGYSLSPGLGTYVWVSKSIFLPFNSITLYILT